MILKRGRSPLLTFTVDYKVLHARQEQEHVHEVHGSQDESRDGMREVVTLRHFHKGRLVWM